MAAEQREDATPARPLLVTHSGKFHCDEVFAYVALRAALGLHDPGRDHRLLRTRDAALIEAGDIVWDVGSSFDAARNRFDHHQRGAPLRPDGTPLSAAGLVWQAYGARAVAGMLPAEAQALAKQIADELDATVVRRIDEIDNGLAGEPDTLSLAVIIGDRNPGWDEDQGDAASDAAFLEAAEQVGQFLGRRIGALRARFAAEAHVVAAHARAADPRLLVLERGMPWKAAVFKHDLPVIFCVSPVPNGNWIVEAMPTSPGAFAQRLSLPEAWAGLENEALAQVTGVADAVFVHLRRFMGAARSRDGALALATKALGG